MPNSKSVAVKKRPILFKGPMVRAILEDRKDRTRRIVHGCVEEGGIYSEDGWNNGQYPRCPYGGPGDHLWVRETWAAPHAVTNSDDPIYVGDKIIYRADGEIQYQAWRPSIFMPRWASRINLENTEIRVERVQDISAEDAIAEGIEKVDQLGILRVCGWKDYSGETPGFINPIDSYRTLWDEINAKRGYSWASNPWVWVIVFKKI